MSIPHFFQTSEQTCGAACLRMLFAALGVAHEEAIIAQHCGLTALGCTMQDLVTGAQSLGSNAELLNIFGEAAAIAVLSNQVPFVAMIDLSGLHGRGPIFQWHFVVPLTLRQGDVTFHDPADGPDRTAALGDFLAAWATAGYPRSARMDPVSRVHNYLLDNVGHITQPGNASLDPVTQHWFVPILCRTDRGAVVVG